MTEAVPIARMRMPFSVPNSFVSRKHPDRQMAFWNRLIGRSRVILRKAIVLAGVTCVALTAFGIVDFADEGDPATPVMAMNVSRGATSASTRGKMALPIQITVPVVTSLISPRRTGEDVLDLLSRTGRSGLQSFCVLRC